MGKHEGLTPKSRRFLFCGLVALDVLIAVPAASESDSLPKREPDPERALRVAPGQVELRRYSREPGTVIIGDPDVAAASVASTDILVLTGLEPGETNIIVLDDSGAQIDRIALRVAEPGTTIVVRRGQERELFRCDPVCAPLDQSGLVAPAPRRSETPRDIDVPVAEGDTPQL